MGINLTPLADRVVVKANEIETKTESGIIIPNGLHGDLLKGKIVAVSSDDKVTSEVGDSIVYKANSGTEIIVDGETYIIMREANILATL